MNQKIGFFNDSKKGSLKKLSRFKNKKNFLSWLKLLNWNFFLLWKIRNFLEMKIFLKKYGFFYNIVKNSINYKNLIIKITKVILIYAKTDDNIIFSSKNPWYCKVYTMTLDGR